MAKTIRTETQQCLACMKTHGVQIVEVTETNIFKGQEVEYLAVYEYCEFADVFSATEEMLNENDKRMKDSYRKAVGLLQGSEIAAIRKKYGISQSDLAVLLGWGEKTITRYESHQVQDRAHDAVLRKIDADPEWFCSMLERNKNAFTPASFQKYKETATKLLEGSSDCYLRKGIKAAYARFDGSVELCGNKPLDINKVIDVIRYFSNSEKVLNLYKVKLFKLMWYADALFFKRYGTSITGLAYASLPMGEVPVCANSIVCLNGIHCQEEEHTDFTGFHFLPTEDKNYHFLSRAEIEVLDTIIDRFGATSSRDIVNTMQTERAYIETAPQAIIQYKYAESLSID